MVRVIINGDDFGMNERCSRAIAEAFEKGRITDTTAMANGNWFCEAIKLAADCGFDDRIGIHLNLTEGRPLTRKICDFPDFVTDGLFNKGAVNLNRKLSEAEEEAVFDELQAQILRLHHEGVSITHADSHHYIHNCAYLLPVVVRVCRANGIDRIRLQRDLSASGEQEYSAIREYNTALRVMGFTTTEHFGRPDDVIYREIPDNTELLVHPDYDRNGVLIDRRGMKEGFPVGEKLIDFESYSGVNLIRYSQLSL